MMSNRAHARLSTTSRCGIRGRKERDAKPHTLLLHSDYRLLVRVWRATRRPRCAHRCGYPGAAIEMMNADAKWISAVDELSCTPLHQAARFGHRGAVKWLLDHGADVNAIAYNGFTPLHLTEDQGVIALIAQNHADLSIRDRAQNKTPLQCAAANLVDARRRNEQEKWRRIVKL
jgi:hypothetical protein